VPSIAYGRRWPWQGPDPGAAPICSIQTCWRIRGVPGGRARVRAVDHRTWHVTFAFHASLRQGELWLDAQRRLFSSYVNEDQTARDQLLEETRQQVRRLEEVVRHQNIAIADLGRQCAQLSNRQNGIEKTMRQEMDMLHSEMVQLTSDVRALPAPGGTKFAEFQDTLCNELQRMSIVLRVGSGPQLPSTHAIEQQIQAAQEGARVLRSPGQSVMGSRPPSLRGASPAPSLCRS